MNNLTVNKNGFTECYDIGGTNIRAAYIADGQLEEPFINEKTEKNNVDSLIRQIKRISSSLKEAHPEIASSQIQAASLAFPGPVEGTKLLGSKPLEFDEEIDFHDHLGEFFNIPLIIGNDLNMASQGELALGEFRETKNFCLLTISTGIGVGVIVNGSLYNRQTEIGHIVLETDPQFANPCLGHSGCWAAQASGVGIEKTVARAGKELSASEIFEEPQFNEIVNKVKTYNAYGIGNLINAYNPEIIVIMGSLGLKQFNKIIPEPDLIRQYTLLKSIPEIVPTALGENIGLFGAYFSAQNFLKTE
jgi:glucokinase